MHFQKHEHYALLFMGELAQQKEVEPLSLAVISKRHGISLPFLKKIVRSLRAAGLIRSKEGVGGGYTLARDSESIALWDIVSAFDERGKLTGSVCPLNTSCLPQHIRASLMESIRERLEKISLKEVAR